MPLVEITLRKGKKPEFLRTVADCVHEALVAQANVPVDDRFQIIHEVEPDGLIAHPSYGGVTRSEGLVIVKITLNAGRTLDVKKSLYADMADRLEKAADVRRDDLMVCLVEVTKENWSFGKGLATYG
jgi:4-oxalocrotonate tautomerase